MQESVKNQRAEPQRISAQYPRGYGARAALQEIAVRLYLRTPAKIMLPPSIVPKGRRQLAPGFNLGTELEKRIEAP
ncbi:MAG: hypothetical protein O2857_19685, partial [Planctomycetota bacterium]|nr:hypothetical protein [Planctomycetota bacterium]